MRALIVFGFFVGGCISRPLLLPDSGGAYALASDNGFSLVADTRAWDGQPSDLEDYATPIALELHNGSQAAGVVRLDRITLSDDLGNTYAAWRIEGAHRAPPASNTEVNPNPPQTPPPSTPSSQPSSAPAQNAIQPVSAEGPISIAWQAEEDLSLRPDFDPAIANASVTPAAYRGGYSGGGRHSGGGRFFGPGRSYGGGRHGGGYSRGSAARGHPSPRGHSGGYGYGAARVYSFGNPYYYRPYWYGNPGFSPYWGVWGPSWGWGWGYGVYFSPGYAWRGSLPPERTDIVRLGLVDGTLQPGSDVRGFVYFGDLAAQAQTVTLKVAVLAANAKDVAANLRATFRVTND